MKKLIVCLLLFAMVGCSQKDKKPTAKEVIQKYNANVVDNVICEAELKIDSVVSQG